MRRLVLLLILGLLAGAADTWADIGWALCTSSDTPLKWAGTPPTCGSSTGTVCPAGDYLWIVNSTTDSLEDCRIAGLTENDTLNTVCGRASGCEITNPTLSNWFQIGADNGEKHVWYLDGGTFYDRRLNSVNAPAGQTRVVETGTTHALKYGTVTSPSDCESLTGAGVHAYANTCKPMKSIFFPAIALEPDGTNCGAHTLVTMNSGPKQQMFSCADSNSSMFFGAMSMLRTGWDTGPIQLTLHAFHVTGENIKFAGDFSAQCRGTAAAVDNTWSSPAAADVDFTTSTANRVMRATTGDITPSAPGSCATGGVIYFRYVIDAANFDTNAANSRVFGVSLHYRTDTRNGLDE